MLTAGLVLLILGSDWSKPCKDEAVISQSFDEKKLPAGASIKDSGYSDRTYRETLVYADGTSVTLRLRGCPLRVIMELRSKAITDRAADAIALMKKTMAALPMLETALRPQRWIEALSAIKEVPEKLPVPVTCPPYAGGCELYLEGEVLFFTWRAPTMNAGP